jgi:cytochrome b subunit of formate dehydrogenase
MSWAVFGSVSVVLVAVMVVGLMHLTRYNERMTSGQKVMWAALIVLLPFIGLTGYLFWQLEHSEVMESAMTGRRSESAPFLRGPRSRSE